MSTKNLTVSVLTVSFMIGIDGCGIFTLAMISCDIGLAKVELLFEELLDDGLTYELLEDGIWDDEREFVNMLEVAMGEDTWIRSRVWIFQATIW